MSASRAASARSAAAARPRMSARHGSSSSLRSPTTLSLVQPGLYWSWYDGGFTRETPVVQWLWSIVLHELTPEDQRAFLAFFTGSDRSPIGGLGSLRPVIQRDGPDSDKLPTSHTCFNTMLLPGYST
ncbi:Ubiquitin-protein ligase E3A, partial [Tetrabaena socialis]